MELLGGVDYDGDCDENVGDVFKFYFVCGCYEYEVVGLGYKEVEVFVVDVLFEFEEIVLEKFYE